MAYTTESAIRSYLGITTTGDAGLITTLIGRAQAAIDTYTQRTFEAGSTSGTVRNFTVGEDTYGRVLVLDEDLSRIDNVVTDADGTPTTIGSTEYITVPRNIKPYSEIKLLSSTTKSWTYTSNAENGIQVTGEWSYSTSPPADIVHACVRLTSFYFRQKDSQVFDVTAIPDAGVITVPQGMPADVKLMLDPYKRVVI
jgi:hypothetical protein